MRTPNGQNRDMLVGTLLGRIACLWFAVLSPTTQSVAILSSGERTQRWLSFYICICVLVLPFAVLPEWFPLRYEIIICTMAFLSSSDAEGAAEVYRKCIVPRLHVFTEKITRARAFLCDGGMAEEGGSEDGEILPVSPQVPLEPEDAPLPATPPPSCSSSAASARRGVAKRAASRELCT